MPVNDNCTGAIQIVDARDFCSGAGQYTNTAATSSFSGVGPDVWFSFVARNFEVEIKVVGASAAGALQWPEIHFYKDCAGSELLGSTVLDGNTTIFKDAGLIPGATYYIGISGANNNTGKFQLCIKNYQSAIKPGQDFETASILCNTTNKIRELNVTGSGRFQETGNTCIGNEKNSAWYTWVAANNGSLVFTITPDKETNDLDWVLYDLGPAANGGQPSTSAVLRCAAGSGVNCTPKYHLTGANFTDTQLTELGSCPPGQDGFVKYIDMVAENRYALVVNNFTEGNNGFEIAFKDPSGKAGSGLFKGPTVKIDSVKLNECTPQELRTFTASGTGYTGLKWYFGEGASIDSADTPGPFNITYSSPGLKTVVLQVENDLGCSVVESHTFTVGLLPQKPVINSNKPDFCILDTIKLSTPEVEYGKYHWTGPNNFSSTQREIDIPVMDISVSGTYRLTTEIFGCMSEETTIDIPPVLKNPTAAFSTNPGIVAKFTAPLKVTFNNESAEADSYLWDFGDGNTSTEVNPVHEYTSQGDFDVTLLAFKSNICQATVVHGTFVIREGTSMFIPNTFTPNGDAVNDEFVITLTNLNAYRIRIFNRWGDQLFETNDIFKNWNGLYKGEPVPVGTYFYIINGLDANNMVIKRSGSVTVIR